ncbi:hypothetical protein MICCA_1480002 [Microcystis aeruginosa PCC 9432]|uniref:Uncharacterized protein n=2 Tax=Microcystis aeruginosa TaxID=1126 RepID=A0A822L576_MICAE|nr:hypothetical protein MICCA_1480002 [Microcystis aeruginosa PCC 9432]CCI05694.1 hypothetical protein MICAD_1270007 [Microcystis aeruginosa PCC 7941]CCI26700.1 hypothetical protein MICAG_3200003 [Microcystis aeruginosa PCC 9808]
MIDSDPNFTHKGDRDEEKNFILAIVYLNSVTSFASLGSRMCYR